MDGQREEGGPERIALFDSSSAVGGAVTDDEREGGFAAEVGPWSNLWEGLQDGLWDGGPVDAVEGNLDVKQLVP